MRNLLEPKCNDRFMHFVSSNSPNCLKLLQDVGLLPELTLKPWADALAVAPADDEVTLVSMMELLFEQIVPDPDPRLGWEDIAGTVEGVLVRRWSWDGMGMLGRLLEILPGSRWPVRLVTEALESSDLGIVIFLLRAGVGAGLLKIEGIVEEDDLATVFGLALSNAVCHDNTIIDIDMLQALM